MRQHLSRLRLLHHQRESTQCGLEEVFWLLCLRSKVCGSRRKNTTNLVLPLFTASASNMFSYLELSNNNLISFYQSKRLFSEELLFLVLSVFDTLAHTALDSSRSIRICNLKVLARIRPRLRRIFSKNRNNNSPRRYVETAQSIPPSHHHNYRNKMSYSYLFKYIIIGDTGTHEHKFYLYGICEMSGYMCHGSCQFIRIRSELFVTGTFCCWN